MRKNIVKTAACIFLSIILVSSIFAFTFRDIIQRTVLGGLKIYETAAPSLPADIRRPAILVFSKTNGFRHEDAIPAANALFRKFARENGWGYFQTENGATFAHDILSRFDVVVFNNVSGDVFTPKQRAAFRTFIEDGGGFVGIHAAGDNSHAAWPWYVGNIIGANFTAHTLNPQFQQATVKVEDKNHPVTKQLPSSWQRTEEWYSFDRPPRSNVFHVLATVDERTYTPEGLFGTNLRMGRDHPAVWLNCIGAGRALYTIFGHRAEAFAETETRTLLLSATKWALRLDGQDCATLKGASGHLEQ